MSSAPSSPRWPAIAILAGCIPLQRICITMGEFKLPAALLVAIAVFAILAAQGRAYLSRTMFRRYLVFTGYALFSAALAALLPPQHTTSSISSLAYVLVVYGLFTLQMQAAPGMRATLEVFRSFVAMLAVCALLQFFAQFAGLPFFSFSGVVPEFLLMERGFNVVIPLWYRAKVYKSNGLFLLEPSMLSQFAAMGIIVEYLYFGSSARMLLLAAALFVAFSGTGLMLLGFALIASGIIEPRLLKRVAKFLAIAGVLGLVVGLLAAPEYISPITGRTSELQSDQSSGFVRFISPYVMLSDVASDARLFLGFGPGTAERFTTIRYMYGVNALTKMLLEYGVIGLLSYLTIVSRFYRKDMRVLSIVGIFWFIFGGGNHLAPAVLYVLCLLFIWGPGSVALQSNKVRPVSRALPGPPAPRHDSFVASRLS